MPSLDTLHPPPHPPSRALFDRSGFAAGLYLLLTLALTFPLAVRFRSAVPAGSIDLWQNYWNLWWWKKALLELHQHPYATRHLFYPTGTDLAFHTHSSFNMVISLPINALWGPGPAYNFCVLMALWLSALGAYLLARELTEDGRGAFLAGLVFGFFPQRLDQSIEQLNLVSTQFLPFTLVYFERLRRHGGSRNIVGLALCYALNALCDWHLGLKLTLMLMLLGAYALMRRSRDVTRLLVEWTLAGALAALILSPAVLPLVRGIAAGESYFQKPPTDRGTDAAFLFRPTFHHPLWGWLTRDAYAYRRAYESIGFICYLGFTPVALAALALTRGRRGSGIWAILFFVSLILSLGARPLWNGRLLENVTLPFALLAEIPVLSRLRVAHRFLIPASLALAVLAAFGWTSLRTRSSLRFTAFSWLIVMEFLPGRYPMQGNRLPPVYAELARSGGLGAVLDIPFTANARSVQNMRAQTVHERPIAGGYTSTLPPQPLRFIETDPTLSDLFGLDPEYRRPLDAEHLRALGFDTVILHKDRSESLARRRREALDSRTLFYERAVERLQGIPDSKLIRLRTELERIAGAPVFENDAITVFALRVESERP